MGVGAKLKTNQIMALTFNTIFVQCFGLAWGKFYIDKQGIEYG